jgi:hypothetical protein
VELAAAQRVDVDSSMTKQQLIRTISAKRARGEKRSA